MNRFSCQRHVAPLFFILHYSALLTSFSISLFVSLHNNMSEQENKNVLDPSVIIHATSQNISTLASPYDAIAAACHSIMLSVGFRFAGLGDDARQGKCTHTLVQEQQTLIFYIEGDGTTKKLPEGWNQQGPHCYNFRYSHPQSSLTFVIKIVRLGDKCIILGLGIGVSDMAYKRLIYLTARWLWLGQQNSNLGHYNRRLHVVLFFSI